MVARGGGVEAGNVAGEVGGKTSLGDLGGGERVFAEVETLVEAGMNLPGGAEWGEVGEEFTDQFGGAGMERADLPGGQGLAGGWVAEFVQVTPRRGFDKILGVPEEVGDGHGFDAASGGGGH